MMHSFGTRWHRRLARVGGAGLALVLLVGLAACGSSNEVRILDAPRSASDELPPVVAESLDEDGGDSAESRFAGADSVGVRYFVAPAVTRGYCLIAIATADDWVLSCQPSLPIAVRLETMSAELVASVPWDPENNEVVGDQILVGRK